MTRMALWIVAVVISASAPSATRGQATKPAARDSAAPEASAQPAAEESPAFFRLDYSGDWPNTPGLTGDWGGARSKLAHGGYSFTVESLHFLQGNAYGGADTEDSFSYFGSLDYILEFDFGRMNLWPGGYARLRGETPFGTAINQDAGAISALNYDALFPIPGDAGETTLTEAWFMQFLSPQLYVLGGKLDPSRLPGQNVFASDYYRHFQNLSFWQNPVGFSMVPYTALTAGVGYIPTKWFDAATLVMDSYGEAKRAGFDTAFHSPNGVSVIQALNFHVKPFGLDANHRLSFAWSSRDQVALDDIDRLLLSGGTAPSFSRLDIESDIQRFLRTGRLLPRLRTVLLRTGISRALAPDKYPDEWGFWYDFDQYLYQEAEDPTQGWGLFGRFGWSPGVINPVESFYSLGVGGKGVIPSRDQDRFGLGYYMLNLSDDFPALLNLDAEQGVEAYYNIEIFPWLHITPDVQVIINPGGGDERDPAVVYGLRFHVSF